MFSSKPRHPHGAHAASPFGRLSLTVIVRRHLSDREWKHLNYIDAHKELHRKIGVAVGLQEGDIPSCERRGGSRDGQPPLRLLPGGGEAPVRGSARLAALRRRGQYSAGRAGRRRHLYRAAAPPARRQRHHQGGAPESAAVNAATHGRPTPAGAAPHPPSTQRGEAYPASEQSNALPGRWDGDAR